MEDHIPLGRCAAKPLLLHLGFHRLKDLMLLMALALEKQWAQ